MKKAFAPIFALALCLCLLPAALADEAVEFTDVPAGSWFEKGVATCAEKGVMIGTNADTFSPERKLTRDECLTLAFRLYDLIRGQEHVIEKAPEKDKLTLTLADGTVFEGYASAPPSGSTFFWRIERNGQEGLCVEAPGWSYGSYEGDEAIKAAARSQQEWLDAHPDVQGHDRPAALTLNGVTYQGTTDCFMPAGPFVFRFQPERGKTEEVNSILRQAVYQGANPELWWWDTAYTITQRGLGNIFNPAYFTDDPASRGFFARLIAAACEGHLEKLNTVEAIPDLSREKSGTSADAYREAAYTLYEAGILTGVDSAGRFAADATLTRAEAAVMVSRVLDKSQRVSASPAYGEMAAQLATEENYTVDWSSDGGYGTVLLRWKPLSPEDNTRDYQLWLVRKDGKAKKLLLPSTVLRPNGDSPTDRAPDSLFISAGETKLVYAYDFTDHLNNGETVYHKAGRYIYTVDLKTGELSVDVPFKPDNVGDAHGSYQRAIDDLKNDPYPLSVDKQLETKTCSLLMGHIYAPHGGHYALKLVFKPGSQPGDGMEVSLPQPRINFWNNGSAPHSLEISEDEGFLTYAYHFDEPLGFDGGILHEAGDYVYTVDLHTGVVAEELLPGNYEDALSRCLQDEVYTVEQTLEGPFCTALLRYSHTDENALAHQSEGRKDYEITLVYKAGTDLPEGTLRSPNMPYTFSGRTADGLGIYLVSDQAPDSMAFSDDGKQFIYSFQFDTPLHDPQGDPVHEAGTYIYTVDVPTGITELDIQSN